MVRSLQKGSGVMEKIYYQFWVARNSKCKWKSLQFSDIPSPKYAKKVLCFILSPWVVQNYKKLLIPISQEARLKRGFNYCSLLKGVR